MSLERHKINPFLSDMLIPVKGRQVRLSRFGKRENILIDQDTGEAQGTHLTTYQKVDGAQFVKLFTQNIAMTFDFTAAGNKTFGVLLWVVQHKSINKDEVDLDALILDDFLESQSKPIKLSIATFKRGLNELEKARIVAKTMRKGRYWINPNFVFNGDRIAFTTLIERSHTKEEQQELDV